MDRTIALRGLQPLREVSPAFLNSQGLKAFLEKSFEEDFVPQELQAYQEASILLDLLREGDDLRSILLNLYGEQVIGLYDPDTKELYLRSEEFSLGPQEKSTFVHEYVHALQDQHFDLSTFLDTGKGNSDLSNALTALVEGDATIAEVLYIRQDFTQDEIAALFAGAGPSPAFDAAPLFIRESLIFPYRSGLEFVGRLRNLSDGWDLVDKAYADPPQSTEHILHPAKYFGKRDDPTEVAPLSLGETLGPDWVQQGTDVLGELGLRLMLMAYLGSRRSDDAAEGWGGDRYTYLKDDAGEQLLALQTTWDTRSDAREFFKAYVDFIEAKSKDAWDLLQDTDAVKWWQAPNEHTIYLEISRDDVLILIAPDRAVAQAVASQFRGS